MKYIDYSDIIFKYNIIEIVNPPETCYFLDKKFSPSLYDSYTVALVNQKNKKKHSHLRLVK
jgi:hypothetical protein